MDEDKCLGRFFAQSNEFVFLDEVEKSKKPKEEE